MPIPLRTLRLRRHADYGLVYGASRKHGSASLSFFYRQHVDPAAEPRPPRFGITVPRALGPAVLRNRIKRRVRIAARAAMHLLPARTDVVLHPRLGVATMPFAALEAELTVIFQTISRRVASGAPNTPQPRSPFRGKGGKAKRPGGSA